MTPVLEAADIKAETGPLRLWCFSCRHCWGFAGEQHVLLIYKTKKQVQRYAVSHNILIHKQC